MSKYLPFNLFVKQALTYPLTTPFLPSIDTVLKNTIYANGNLTGTLTAAAIHTGQEGVWDSDGDDATNDGTPKSYTDNGDGTVTDNHTGYVWQKDHYNDGATMTWAAAIDLANAATTGGFSDWILPSYLQLATLLNYDYPAWSFLNSVFTQVGWGSTCSGYWTSTTVGTDGEAAYFIEAYDGTMFQGWKGDNSICGVRLLRKP